MIYITETQCDDDKYKDKKSYHTEAVMSFVELKRATRHSETPQRVETLKFCIQSLQKGFGNTNLMITRFKKDCSYPYFQFC